MTAEVYRRYRPGQPASDEVDWAVVDRACCGERLSMTCAERRETVRRLTAKGWSAAAIADLLRITDRSVFRHRAAPETPAPRRYRPAPPCGTYGAYRRHLAWGEECSVCWEAMRPYWRERARAYRRRVSQRKAATS